MPPRKKTKLSSRQASSPPVDTPNDSTPAAVGKASEVERLISRPVLDPDPWTDDQEAALFKSIVRYKPVGLHRHTRMYCILTSLRRYGWNEEHITRKGIWQKLDTLYNMETLHEREDADDLERGDDEWTEFWLPKDDFGEAMFSRRISTKRSSSPPTLRFQLSPQRTTPIADIRRRRASAVDRQRNQVAEPLKHSSTEPDDKATRNEPRGSLRGRSNRRGRRPGRRPSEPISSRKRKRADTPPDDEDEAEDEDGSDEEDGEEEDGPTVKSEEDADEDEEGDEEEEDEEEGDGEGEDEDGEEDDDEEGEEEDDDEEDEDEESGEEETEEQSKGKTTRARIKEPSRRGGRGARGRGTRGRARQRGSGKGSGAPLRSGRSVRGKPTRGGRAGRGGRGK